ncbi:exosortase/archaeosortase family protein, partial [Candidatus Bathyarchaeota archaeon]|nr:exosortase/archaeosortase family protein [Candidatus Bathyarchaeota archaeon]
QACPFLIAWPCAGVESLIIYTLVILLFLKESLIPWKQRIVYFAIGAIVTYFINVLRIVTIFVISIPCHSTQNAVWRFHNIYGQLYSIAWIISYPLIIIGTRVLWQKIRSQKEPQKMNRTSAKEETLKKPYPSP